MSDERLERWRAAADDSWSADCQICGARAGYDCNTGERSVGNIHGLRRVYACMALADSEAASLRGQVETLQAELAAAKDETGLAWESAQHWKKRWEFQCGETDAGAAQRVHALAQRDRARDIAAHLATRVENAIDDLQATQIIGWADQKWVKLTVAHGALRSVAAHLEAELAKEGE